MLEVIEHGKAQGGTASISQSTRANRQRWTGSLLFWRAHTALAVERKDCAGLPGLVKERLDKDTQETGKETNTDRWMQTHTQREGR